jgi:hypothetical protein
MNVRFQFVRGDNDNLDVTRLTLMAFGPSLIVACAASALWLVSVW